MAASINKSEFDVALDDLCWSVTHIYFNIVLCTQTDIVNNFKSSRFIFNSPKEEHEHSNRILFQCERAWWYYCDFYFPMGKQFPELTFEQFVAKREYTFILSFTSYDEC